MGFPITTILAALRSSAIEDLWKERFPDADGADRKCRKSSAFPLRLPDWRREIPKLFQAQAVRSPAQQAMHAMVGVTKQLDRARIAIEFLMEREFLPVNRAQDLATAQKILDALVIVGRSYDAAVHATSTDRMLDALGTDENLSRIFGGSYLVKDTVAVYEYPDAGEEQGVNNLVRYRTVRVGSAMTWYWTKESKEMQKARETSVERSFQRSSVALQRRPDRMQPIMVDFNYSYRLKEYARFAQLIFLAIHAHQISRMPAAHDVRNDQRIRDHFTAFVTTIQFRPDTWETWADDFVKGLR